MPGAHELHSQTRLLKWKVGAEAVLELILDAGVGGQLELTWASWAPWAVTTEPQHWQVEDIQRWEDRPDGEERAGEGRRKKG